MKLPPVSPEAGPGTMPPSNDAPTFHSFDTFKPRTGALLDGAVLAFALLCGASWAMSYGWTHTTELRPILVESVPSVLEPEAQPIAPDADVTSKRRSGGKADFSGARAELSTGHAQFNSFQSYDGTYTEPLGPEIVVRVDGGQLYLQVAGEPRVALVPVSATQFRCAAGPECWVEFFQDEGGFSAVDVHLPGKQFVGHRVAR